MVSLCFVRELLCVCQARVHDLGEGKSLLMMDRLALQRLVTLVCVESPDLATCVDSCSASTRI